MKLVGLDELKSQMTAIVSKADTYKKGGVKIPHIVMNLTHANGQSAVAEYIADILYENDLRKFRGLDILLEYTLDGSLKQMKQVFNDIASCAVYTNEYEGVIAIDVSALSGYVNEYQTDYFEKKLREVAEKATMIIYYDASLGRKVEQIRKRIVSTLGKCIEVTVEPYSQHEYSEIVVQNIIERGIEVESEEELARVLYDAVGKYNVANAKQAAAVADDLAFCVDYSGIIPKITAKAVSEYLGNKSTYK